MPNKANLFDDFEEIADDSEGLKTINQTTISISQEPRRHNIITVTTGTEAQRIRDLCSQLSIDLKKRVTVSNVGREFFLMLLGESPADKTLRDHIVNRLGSDE